MLHSRAPTPAVSDTPGPPARSAAAPSIRTVVDGQAPTARASAPIANQRRGSHIMVAPAAPTPDQSVELLPSYPGFAPVPRIDKTSAPAPTAPQVRSDGTGAVYQTWQSIPVDYRPLWVMKAFTK